MYERNYYKSSYVPDGGEGGVTNPRHGAPHNLHAHAQPAVHKYPRLRRALYFLAALAAVVLFLIWLFLGQFRFVFWRYPSLTGFPFGTREYLVVFQNNNELRPTGGFISTYGVLKFSHGFYSGLDFYDVYGDIDNHPFVEPPLVLSTLLKGNGYTTGHNFRDANFDPDFRLSADELIKFYNMAKPDEKVDGVIAADFSFLEDLVALYEPMEVDGYSLTKDNLFETLTTVASDIDRHNEDALANRKNITTPLVKEIITKTFILPWRIGAVLNTVAEGFKEKHVLAAFERSGIASSFHSRGWDGALPQSDMGDALAVNEANYGGMKSDRYITRAVQYELTVTNQRDVLGNPVVNAVVTVTLSHEGNYNIPMSGPYTGYLRVMVPIGSDIINGATISEERKDTFVLGELVSLNPGESVSYSYSYELPEYVWNDGEYYLHLHKQPGTNADSYRIIVHAPDGMGLTAPLFQVHENLALYNTFLDTDQNLEFSLLPDENPPRVVSHEITADNEITIIFNEQLNVDHASDAGNYSVVDTDFKDTAVTDQISVETAKVDGSAVTLILSGMTNQPEERYAVSFQGITDTAGNLIKENPRVVTVIRKPSTTESQSTETTTEITNE